MQKVTLGVEETKKDEVVYPKFVGGCKADIFINGYLIKTAYMVSGDPKADIVKLRMGKEVKLEDLELLVRLEAGGMRKELEVAGLFSRLVITAWEMIE